MAEEKPLTRAEKQKKLAALTPEQRAELAKLVKEQVDKGNYRDVPEEEEE